jgi:hypothetical protein
MEVSNDHSAVIEGTVEVSTTVVESGLFITDIDDEICSDEEYYEEIDPGEAFTCF